jgi:hypothetical protein
VFNRKTRIIIAAILFSISSVTLAQFGFYYWRAMLVANSMAPVSERVRLAAGIPTDSVHALDFRAILKVHDFAPSLSGTRNNFRAVRMYYGIVETLGSLVPSVRDWANAEQTMCSRYLATLTDRHLERNMDCAAALRGN